MENLEMRKNKQRTVLTIAEAAVRKGIHNPHQLHQKTGISVPRSNKLWQGKGKIELTDIDAICDNLPCKIKDIIQRVPAGDED